MSEIREWEEGEEAAYVEVAELLFGESEHTPENVVNGVRQILNELDSLCEVKIDHLSAVRDQNEPLPGDPIVECSCPCCLAHLDITHGDDPGEISVVGSPSTRAHDPATCPCWDEVQSLRDALGIVMGAMARHDDGIGREDRPSGACADVFGSELQIARRALGMPHEDICEWCDELVNNGETHGEGQCFDTPCAAGEAGHSGVRLLGGGTMFDGPKGPEEEIWRIS